MKINVDQVLKNLDGSNLKDSVNGEVVDAILQTALINAILAPSKDDNGVTKIQKYELARKIYKGGEVELTSEEITVCKKAVEATYPSPLIVGQVVEMLENK